MRIKEATTTIIIGFIIAILYTFIAIAANDAPHNASNNISCGSCHGEGLLQSFYGGSGKYSTVDDLCLSCHTEPFGPYLDTKGPFVKTHSDAGGNALAECCDCHNPHYQRQKVYKNTDASNLYLATGKIQSCEYSGKDQNTNKDISTFYYSDNPPIIYKTGTGWDATKLPKKTWDYRGAILFPNIGKLGYNYSITAVNANTITVNGNLTTECSNSYFNSTTFAVIYGQYIKESILTDEVNGTYSPVKFFDKIGQGSFAYDDDAVPGPDPTPNVDPTRNGVCQVCHTDEANPDNPTHWRANGTGADHYNNYEKGCIYCHWHSWGFVHGGVGGGTGCIECHGHDKDYEYETGKYSKGDGTFQSHSTHTENDSDDLKGPNIGCDSCHDTNNFPYFIFKQEKDSNGDGKIDLSETDVCDGCHSPDGSFDGVGNYDSDNPNFETENPLSVAYGAKYNWKAGIYSGNSLKTGKEKWCISCHDSGTSEIKDVSAPDVKLYYTSGHGKAGADVECLACHDATFIHTDGKHRTYAFNNEDVNPADGHADIYDWANSGVAYASGYRLRYVNGKVPFMIPTDYNYTFGAQEGLIKNNTNRRCFNTGCHDASKIFGYGQLASAYTNFSFGPPDPPQSYGPGNGWGNIHQDHMRYIIWDSDWDVNTGYPIGFDSMITCSSCHNVHGAAGTNGSTNEPMIRDGSLEGGAGYGFSYLIEDPVQHYPYVTSQGATRANSVGAIFRNGVDNMCGFCHPGEGYVPPENSYYAAPEIIYYEGINIGSTSNNTLKVDGNPWTEGALVGKYVRNITDGSEDIITGNTTNTVTGDGLIGGHTNLWQPGDQAEVFEYNDQIYMQYFRTPRDLSSTVDMIWTYDSDIDGGKDYIDLGVWEQDTDIDITPANNVIVLSHSGLIGSILSGNTVTGANSGATGVVIGVVTATQICIEVSGGTFQKGEQIYETQDVNYVVSTSYPAHVGVMYLDCYDGPHNDRVTMAGATTDAMHYRCIRSASDCTKPFAGKRETGAYFEWNANNHLFRIDENYSRVEHIGAKLTYNAAGTKNVFWLHGDYTKAIGCVAYDSTNSGTGSINGFLLEGANTIAANCIAHNIEGDGFSVYGSYPFGNSAINCTSINNGGIGFTGGSYISLWNCVASNNGADFNTSPGYCNCEYNMSSDGTAYGATSKITKDFTNMWVNETYGSEDYHLSQNGVVDSDFQGGTDPETFYAYGQYKVSDDIDGETRTIWYRGADEFGPPGNNYEFIYISGRVGTLDGVTMSGLPGNSISSEGGFYSAVAGHGWSGTVTPEKEGYTFNPAYRSYSNVTSDQTNQDYTPAINTYTISGHVGTLDGVTMSGLHGNPVTSGGGFYSGTKYYGEFISVVPLKDGYSFTPSSRQYYEDVTSDQENQDYTPIVTHIVSGHIGTLDEVTMSGLPGNPLTPVTSGGFYSTAVNDGWSGTVSPSKVGYMFAPASRSYSNVTTDQTNQDYTPTEANYTISGRVGTMDGVTMSGLPGNPVTSSGGFYSAVVGYSWDNKVTPIKAGYNFSPPYIHYYHVSSNYTNQDYTPSVKTFTISGYVDTLSGVTMNGLPGNPVTNSSGFYTAPVNWGWSGTVTPTKAGYTFSPTNRAYSSVTCGLTNQNYTPQ
jgi:hypothetical protein